MRMILTSKKSKRLSFFGSRAFTLAELIVVVVVVSLMAAFAVPSYRKVMTRSTERSATMNIMTIHGANEIYRAKSGGNDEYAPGAGLNLAGINTALPLNIVDNRVTYSYTRATTTTYTVTAALAGQFTLTLDEGRVTYDNPCCSAGTCQRVPNC